MKKLQLLAGLFILSLMVSCEKEMMDSQLNSLSKSGGSNYYSPSSSTQKVASTPTSDGGIIPYIIPGANRGGNRTCEEVGIAFDTTFALCGSKLNYGNFDSDANLEFDGTFPEGLNVKIEGNFISFEMIGCLAIGDKNYQVGAVIVKGSNAANIYYYPEGTQSDEGLAAPGGCKMISNLTFCFFECEEQPEWVIALKTHMSMPDSIDWLYAVSGGQDSEINSQDIGYNYYIFNIDNTYPLMRMRNNIQLGTIVAKDYIDNNIRYIEVTIDAFDDRYVFQDSYLYIGTLEGFNTHRTLNADGTYSVAWSAFPFIETTSPGNQVFKIPFTNIVE